MRSLLWALLFMCWGGSALDCSLPWKEMLQMRQRNRASTEFTGYLPTLFVSVINSNQTSKLLDASERLYQAFIWTNGPFTSCRVVISLNDWIAYCQTHQSPFEYEDNISPTWNHSINILLFDYLDRAWKCIVLPQAKIENPMLLIPFFHQRYQLPIRFQMPSISLSQPFELKWVHFRGNTKLYELGHEEYNPRTNTYENQPLYLYPGDTIKQQTHGGHMFALVDSYPSTHSDSHSNSNSNSNLNFDDFLPFHKIVGLYVIPTQIFSSTSSNQYLVIDLHPVGYSYYHTQLLQHKAHLIYQNTDKQCDKSKKSFPLTSKKDFNKWNLLTYWEYQRFSHVHFNSWKVVSLLPHESSAKNHPTKQQSQSSKTDNLWKKINLSQEVTATLKEWYLKQRNEDNGISPRQQEAFISMVFNQHEIPTNYVPLPITLLRQLEAIVLQEIANWLYIPIEELTVTGSYGCREYMQDAIVRWHVDPVETQPLTAIIHIADERSSAHENSKNPWYLQIPKEIHGLPSDLNAGNLLNISLAEGEMIILQTAKVPHARLYPLTMSYYSNVFVHAMPSWWQQNPIIQQLSFH